MCAATDLSVKLTGVNSIGDQATPYSYNYDESKFVEKLSKLTPTEQEAVRKFWRSLVLRSQRAFSEENGRPTDLSTSVASATSGVRSCNCCPYGYHIDLDFVRYCESLANAKPSEEQLRRRDRRRSRKSMEVMLGFESLFEQWDADARVQAKLTEASQESEPDSPRIGGSTLSHSYNTAAGVTPITRPRSSSVPRFTYGGARADSPYGTASSTCSSLRGGVESDAAVIGNYTCGRPANSPPETRAFLHEALDEVCSDFERTLERASVKRRKDGNYKMAQMSMSSDRNNNLLTNGYGTTKLQHKRQGQAVWERYLDMADSCIDVNKSPRTTRVFSRSHTLPLQQRPTAAELQYESYVQATVAANAKSPVEQLETPPPPPPRKHHLTAHASQRLPKADETDANSNLLTQSPMTSPGSDVGVGPDAQALYNIRQQMALSVKHMKDLEEQVKKIPEMQHELTELRAEKERLQQTVARKNEELQRAARATSSASPPSPSVSPKLASPVQFTPQRISPVSLESMGARLRTNSASSERTLKSLLKRDVGTMCGLHTTRDVGVGSPVMSARSVGTQPAQQLNLKESLYTQTELDQRIKVEISKFSETQRVAQLKKLISVGTQMYVPKRELRESSVQTQAERPVLKHHVSVSAKPATRDNFVSCKPDMRTVGSSLDRVDDVLCEKCARSKRSVACSTEEELPAKTAVSLKLMETLPVRSNTFSLGEQEKLNIKRKTIGTQYTPIVVHSAGSQTSATVVHTVGVQSVPEVQCTSVQCQVETRSCHTATENTTRLRRSEMKIEEIAAPVVIKPAAKPATSTTASNTDAPPRTVDLGVNTKPQPPPPHTAHAAANTEQVQSRDVACGDIVKPHISIACADNYCDSCKDAIKNLAKDFTKVTAASPLPTRAVDSRIPRPKHLTSPSPVRRKFQRQNTYTITPSPTPSPSTEKKSLISSLQEKPPIEAAAETQCFITEPKQSKIVEKRSPGGSYDLTQLGEDELIVREEKRVSISWSRDASPAPLPTAQQKQLEREKQQQKLELQSQLEQQPQSLESDLPQAKSITPEDSSGSTASTPDLDVSKGARKKSSTPLKSSQSEESQITVIECGAANAEIGTEKPPTKAMLQKLAMSESTPRQKKQVSKELSTALKIINDSLLKKLGAKPFSSASLKSYKATIQDEWFRISSVNNANPHDVEDYLDHFEALSVPLLEYCVNLADNNGNTAMHYAVSHGNFDVVSILLDSKVCNVNQMNNAGYTCVMLVSLAKLKNAAHRTVVERLFQMADVNIRAKKHCQTALMLAVSHGNGDMVTMLLAAGADINIQDEDGSTALMCAAEHGRVDIVKHLLSHPDCDSLIQDMDSSTAFKIAWQAGHRDVGLLIYVHEQMLRSKFPNRGEKKRTTSLSPRHKQPPSI